MTTQTRSDQEQLEARFRIALVNCQTAFTNIRPLIQQASLLSMNAEILSSKIGTAGQGFGIIAKEVVTMLKDLEKLIEELELVFKELAYGVATWIQSERTEGLMRRTLAIYRRDHAEQHGKALAPTDGDAGLPAVAGPASENNFGLERLVGESLDNNRKQMNENVKSICILANRLSKYLDRISWVAVRQSHFTAISAKVEAARMTVDRESNIMGVAEEFSQLAANISKAESEARNQVITVHSQAADVSKQLQREQAAA